MDVKKIELFSKQTQPPKRYTQASIIKELEKRGLGTKATRAQILENLYTRGYVDETSITVTGLGKKTVEVLQKYSPTILDEKLTRKIEEEMEEIREGKKKEKEVLEEARQILDKILQDFKKNEKQIGSELVGAAEATEEKQNYIGKCTECDGNLTIKKGKFGYFIACTKYPECRVTFSLPSKIMVKSAEKNCEVCNTPNIFVIRKGKQPQELCLNPYCESKLGDSEIAETLKKIEAGNNIICPVCKKGHLRARKSLFGVFIGCDQYPRCNYVKGNSINSINGNVYPKKTLSVKSTELTKSTEPAESTGELPEIKKKKQRKGTKKKEITKKEVKKSD